MLATLLVLCSALALGAHTARDVHRNSSRPQAGVRFARDYHDRHALAKKFYDTAKGGQPVTDKVTVHQYEIM